MGYLSGSRCSHRTGMPMALTDFCLSLIDNSDDLASEVA